MPKLNITMKIDKINQIFEDEFNLLSIARKKELYGLKEIYLIASIN